MLNIIINHHHFCYC